MLRNSTLLIVMLLLSISVSACVTTEGDAVISTSTPAAAIEDQQPSTMEVPDDQVRELMDILIFGTSAEMAVAREQIISNSDTRFIAVMVELMRAAQIGLIPRSEYRPTIEALESLSGESFGDDWPAWVEWYGATELQPPPGFTAWKGQLLGRIDRRFADFLYEGATNTIRVEEIQWGGVRVDGIPALDNPNMLAAPDATYLLPEEPVFGLVINGDVRAYPLRILDWHEMANDVIGGQEVSLAYCTLCGAAIAFDGLASDGETYTFGSSGFLYRSNKLMYDRQTRTLWNQFTGEPVLGELADQGVSLNILPVVLTTWENWVSQHPETIVVDLETGFQRDYQPGAAYAHYFSAETTMFPVWQRSALLDTKDQVFAIRLGGEAKAYPIDILLERRVVNDNVGENSVVLITSGDRVTVDAEARYGVGDVTYSAGAEVRAYERAGELFSPGVEANEILDSDGGVWIVTEDALIGPDDERLERLGGHLAYWFGWYAFFPNTAVYGID